MLKLIAVPQRRSTATVKPARANFRRRYDELEARRAALVARLTGLGEAARRHPGYRRALTLLNDTFRKEKLTQRLAVLQAAAWLIDVLEKLTTVTRRRRGCRPRGARRQAEIAACGTHATLIAVSGEHRACRVSSGVEQRFCKPLVGGSNPSPGTGIWRPALGKITTSQARWAAGLKS